MRQSIICFAIAVLLGGCAAQSSPVEVTRLAGWGSYSPQPFIKVLQAPPNGLYVPIARLVVNAAAGLDRAQALTALEQKARELGANALIVSDETRPAAADLTFNPSGGTYTLEPPQSGTHLVGEAIHSSASDTH